MDEFLNKLKKALEKERKTETEEMEKEIMLLSGRDREKKGRAILDLQAKIIREEFGYKVVKAQRKKEIVSEIATGDSVIISDGDPLRHGQNGTVIDVGKSYLLIAAKKLPFKNIRVDFSVSNITFQRMYENLENLNEQGFLILEYFLGKETPSSSQKSSIFSSDQFNIRQKEAISLSLGSESFFLLHGPFGTGKTKTAAEIIIEEVKRGGRVLATAESNIAVDNIIEELQDRVSIVRLGHPARSSFKEVTLPFLLERDKEFASAKKLKGLGETIRQEQNKFSRPTLPLKKIMELSLSKKGSKHFSSKEIDSMAKWISLNEKADAYYEGARALEEIISQRIIKQSQVVLSTNSSSVLAGGGFDLVIVDEASQATVPSILIPLSQAPRFVLVGDHKQLPPTVMNKDADILKHTLFEELIFRFPENSVSLNVQYRMGEDLMRFPSEEFYEGNLKADQKKMSLLDLGVDDDENFLFIDTAEHSDRLEAREKDSFSIHNKLEAEIVKKVLESLLKKGVKKEWIGVITPYEDQAELIRKTCNTEAYTVDGYQGQEREVMILSFVRSNKSGDLGFLTDMRRLNVSLTRAKRKMILIGDSKTLSANKTYRRLLRHS